MEAPLILFFIVGLPCIAVAFGVIGKQWLTLKEKQLDIQSSQSAEKAAQYAARSERLEQRVRVLERIAVDKGTALRPKSKIYVMSL